MALNRQAVDSQRKLNNQAPLTDAEWLALTGQSPIDDSAAKEAAAEEERKRIESENEKAKAEEEKNKSNQQPAPVVITDDVLFAELAKRGIQATSIDDLRKKEEVEAELAAEEREANILTWGLQNKKIKKAEYENFIAATKDPASIIYQMRLQEAKKEDPNLSEDLFRAEFNEEFGLDQATTTRRYKNGVSTLNHLAEKVLKTTYGSIYGLENEYSQYENSEKSKTERHKKIKEGLPVYSATLDKVFTDLKKIKAQFSESDEYEVEVLDDSLASLKAKMSDPSFVESQITAGYTPENLAQLAWSTLVTTEFPKLSLEIAKQYLKKHAAGTVGIPPVGKGKQQEGVIELSPEHQTLKNIIEQNKKAEPATAN